MPHLSWEWIAGRTYASPVPLSSVQSQVTWYPVKPFCGLLSLAPKIIRACRLPSLGRTRRVLLTSRAVCGFTVTELLATIAVMGVLAALLLTSIGRVKQKAQTAQCTSHLKQLGGALFAYAADFNGKIPPRFADDIPSDEPRGWPARLLKLGYLGNPDILFCPSFFPRNNAEAIHKPTIKDASQTYGMREWIAPGTELNLANLRRHKPLNAIREPADFFLIADSFWAASGWRSQGYAISPAKGGNSEQSIHLRHSKMANALFADGHVEAKPGSYFLELSAPERQADYMGGSTFSFSVTVP